MSGESGDDRPPAGAGPAAPPPADQQAVPEPIPASPTAPQRPSGKHPSLPPRRPSGKQQVIGARRISGEHRSIPFPGKTTNVPAGAIPITDPRIEQYLHSLSPTNEPVLLEMERLAYEQDFPIIGPLVGRLLKQLALTLSARDIFEMGSGFGYSTYFLAQAVGDGGRVVHTNLSAERSQLARTLLGQAGLADRVAFEVGDAVEAITHYPGPFDMVFIDIDKERYPEALELALARVRPGGYIVTDNVLWYGKVLDRTSKDGATLGVLRYLKAALSRTDLYTTILPLRDGVALHLKLPEPRRKR